MLTPGERQASFHVAQADVAQPFDTPSESPDQLRERQLRNLREWQIAYGDAKSDGARQILREELQRGKGIDFPGDPKEEMQFSILSAPGATPPEQTGMQFAILGAGPNKHMPPAAPATFDPGVRTPDEKLAETPSGAVTGRVPSKPINYPVRGPGSPDNAAMGRFLVEGGASAAGGIAGGVAGGLLTRTPVGTTAGIRAGETGGAFLGSLLSETFDPTPHPITEAAKAAGIVLGTGLVVDAGAGVFKRLIGKPHEGGQELLRLMEAEGKVPLPGAVLESEFIRNTQSFGSAAFGTSELLKKAQMEMEGVTSTAVKNYVSGFQRYHDSAKNLFAEVDRALATPLPTQATAVTGNALTGSAAQQMTAPGARFFLKGDEKARDAILDVARNWVNRTGRADAMPSGLQKMHAWAEAGGPAPKFTFEETQQVYDALFNKARILDQAAKNKDVSEVAGTNTAAYIREQAMRVKKAFDDQLDAAINSKAIDPETKGKLAAARANWQQWVMGQEVERIVSASTHDVAGNGIVSGKKLLNELDKLAKLDRQVSGRDYVTLSKEITNNVRRYALAAEAVEKSGKQGAYALAGRAGQLIGVMGALGAATGGIGAVAGGILSFPLLAPHVVAYTFANPHAASLLIRGLKVEPGTAAAGRIGRELFALWEKENLIGRDENPDLPDAETPNLK